MARDKYTAARPTSDYLLQPLPALPSVSSAFLKDAVTAPLGTSTSDSQTPNPLSHHHLASYTRELETEDHVCASLSWSF